MPSLIKYIFFAVFLGLTFFCMDHAKADIVLKADQHIGDDSVSEYTPEHPVTNDQIQEYPSHFHLSQSVNITQVEISDLQGLDGDRLRVYIDNEFVGKGNPGSSIVDVKEHLDGNKVHTIAVRARCFDSNGNLKSCSNPNSEQDNDIAFSKINLVCDGTTNSINRIQRRHIGDSYDTNEFYHDGALQNDWYYDLLADSMAWYPDQNTSDTDQTLSIPFSVNSRRSVQNATFFRFRDIDNDGSADHPYPEVFIDGDPIGNIDHDEPTGSITISNIDKTVYAGSHTLDIEYQCANWSFLGYCTDWDDVSWDSVILQFSPDSTAYCPPNNVFSDSFEDGSISPWKKTGQGDASAGVNGDTAGAGSKSMFLANGTIKTWTEKIDLSGTTSANLSIWVRRGADSFSGYPEAGENLFLEYRNNNNQWKELQEFPGGGTPGEIYEPSHALPGDALHKGFRIRVRLVGDSRPDSYYWHVDNVCLIHSSGIDHFKISHPDTAVTCMAVDVTFTAHDKSHDPVYLPAGGTISLSTNTTKGTWSEIVSGNGTLNDSTSGDGEGEYTFPVGESSTTLAFNYTDLPSGTNSTHVDINAAYNGINENTGNATSSEDPSLLVSRTGLVFINQTDSTHSIPTQISGKYSNQAPGAKDLGIQAVKASDEDQSVCEPVFSNQGVSIQIAAECRDPDQCTDRNLKLDNNGTTYEIQTNDDNNAPLTNAYTNAKLQFENNSIAPIHINYFDAGKMQLHTRHEILSANGTSTGEYMVGSSNQFVVRPFGFHIGLSNNPGATNASGDIFKTAGKDFNVNLTSVAWESEDDTDEDGIPDSNSGLENNTITPNFGQESTPENATLTHNLFEPSSGHPGSLSRGSFTNFSNGNSTQEISWNEVGIISLNATLTDNEYLDSGQNVIGSLEHVGRFIPDHFQLSPNTPFFQPICNGFTYLDQSFYYFTAPEATLNALSANNNTTQNYGNDFWKFKTQNDYLQNRSYTDLANATASFNAIKLDDANATGQSNFDGSWKFSLHDYNNSTTNGDEFQYAKNGTEDPFNATVDLTLDKADLTDQDDVCYEVNGKCANYTMENITGTELRYGRTTVENAYGSDLRPLTNIGVRTEYYDGSSFKTNTNDTCTVYNATEIGWSSATYEGNLTENHLASSGDGIFQDGEGTFSIHKDGDSDDGPEETGYVDYRFPMPTWLHYDWNDNGTRSDPPARATFGIYKGNEHIIYQQETTWK